MEDENPEESMESTGSPLGEGSSLAHDEVYCTSCGATIKEEAEICPECGVRQQVESTNGQSGFQFRAPSGEKDPGIAAILSFFITGLGQIYNGQIAKGLILMVIQFFNVFLMFVIIGLLTFPLVWAFGIYDAYTQAQKINRGEVIV